MLFSSGFVNVDNGWDANMKKNKDKTGCVIGKSILGGVVLGSMVYLVVVFWLWIIRGLV